MRTSILCILSLGLLATRPAAAQDIYINHDTVVNNTWVLPAGAILHFGSGGHISGSGTIRGGIINAAATQWIFDTSLTLQPAATYGPYFSACWLGAGKVADNSGPLQKSINTIIQNQQRLRHLYIPAGTYAYSRPLQVQYQYKGQYAAATLHLYGDANSWDCCAGTTLLYTGTTGYALGLQLNKGTEINNLIITGQFKAPVLPDTDYYSLPMEKFTDANGRCGPGYAGIVIDYDGSRNSSGSTGVQIHDVQVGNFDIDYLVSPNGKTFNADVLLFQNIRCGDARIGFANGQAQEKGNTIRGIYSWGNIHTLYSAGRMGKSQAGHYTIDGGNIAGRCIRLLDITQAGWYPTHISNLYAESIGSIGSISTQVPTAISNCTFHFALPRQAGRQTLLTCNSQRVAFSHCLFRYYGQKEALKMRGDASFTNCFFSGPLLKQ
jgi:hypothetical protein